MAETFVAAVGPWIRMEAFKALVADQPNPIQPLDDWVDANLLPLGLGGVDILRFLLCMFGSFPLAIVHRNLPSVPLLKHLYTAALGLFMVWFSFREQSLHTLFAAVVTYLIVAIAGSNKATPKFVFVFNCAYLFTCHIHQQFSNWGGYMPSQQCFIYDVRCLLSVELVPSRNERLLGAHTSTSAACGTGISSTLRPCR